MQPKNQISFLRAQVNHYSFVTGLLGKLAGKSGGPEDCSDFLNVILSANVIEGKRVINPLLRTCKEAPYHNVLQGAFFECCDLLTFISGTYDATALKENNNGYIKPTKFAVEVWETEDDLPKQNLQSTKWQYKRNVIWGGVDWLDAAHTGDGGDSMCAGIATFTCTSKIVEEIEDGEIIVIPGKTINYRYELKRLLQDKMAGPKHSPAYMG